MDRIERRGLVVVVWRVLAIPIAIVALAVSPMAGAALAELAATQVITAVPVGTNGQPINGYHEAPSDGNVTAVSDCTTPSPSAVADDIYYCSPSAANAGTCWPSTPGSLLCVDDPWSKLRRRLLVRGSELESCDPLASSQGAGSCIDRASPLWTVKVGELGSPGEHFAPPETRGVTTAWFAESAV